FCLCPRAALRGLPSFPTRRSSDLSALSLSYDRVLMDLAAGAGPALLRLAAAAEDTLVVLADEPTSLTDAYALVKMLRLRDEEAADRKSTRLNSSHVKISYAVFCLK